eukprot:747964-Hanusia_phi.AAC.1
MLAQEAECSWLEEQDTCSVSRGWGWIVLELSPVECPLLELVLESDASKAGGGLNATWSIVNE